ncbi:serpin family protein [Microcoleus sp. ARI1-B5]|uniref:serpin family protein n=1 Tax=unclassified Microcoleus TaxID=2642155 RepID=UPI002FD00486
MRVNSLDDVSILVKGNNAFAIDLYDKLRHQEGNLFFSPYSISTALAMTYAGARGETASEMANVLHFELEPEHLHPAFAALMADLNIGEDCGYQLNTANRLWGQQGFAFLDAFLQTTKDYYSAALALVDFIRATEEARCTINTWVAQQTQEKIQNQIREGILTGDTRLVLTNAIYFKGNWASQFDRISTKEEPFTIAPDEQVNVPMMFKGGAFRYASLGDLQVLELPYVGDRLSMVILLPSKLEGLAQLEQQLTSASLEKWLSSLYITHELLVWLPKFKLTSEFMLNQALSDMGMPLAFDKYGADFTGMTTAEADLCHLSDEQRLHISAVIHKAFVDVNEEGTEAAAATAVVMARSVSISIPTIFRADRPFIFLIRDTQFDSILFLGRVVNPLIH